jgi:hypothetical protein
MLPIRGVLLKPHHIASNQQVVANGRLAVAISTPTIPPNVVMNLPSRIHPENKAFQRMALLRFGYRRASFIHAYRADF